MRLEALLNEARSDLPEDEYEELLEGASGEIDARLDPCSDSDDEEQWEPDED
jgi:hypothetical protein